MFSSPIPSCHYYRYSTDINARMHSDITATTSIHVFFCSANFKEAPFLASSHDIHGNFSFQLAWNVQPFFCATLLLSL